jgi:hypothetical protein
MGSARIFKNKTGAAVTIGDLGGVTIPAGGQKDLVNEAGIPMAKLAMSNSLVGLLGQGTDKYQINDGDQDYDMASGITLILGLAQRFPTVGDIPKFRADSRPEGTSNYFTMRGDDASTSPKIGNGKSLKWDFAGTEDDVDNTAMDAMAGAYGGVWPYQIPVGMKAKLIQFKFSEATYLKEGTLYFYGADFGSYCDMLIVCPQGQYYYNREGQPVQATSGPVILSRYCNGLLFHGDCPMGDEFNAEGCTERAIPPNYEWWLMVVAPSADDDNRGYVEMEVYRPRTCLLPGEGL